MGADLKRIAVDPVQIDAYSWPEATLLRYEVFTKFQAELQQDLLMHLDADMMIVDDVGADLDPTTWLSGLALVRHPGFRRPQGAQGLAFYARHPSRAVKDSVLRLGTGGIGTWERRQASRANVSRSNRHTYVCGGTWFGLRDPFLSMVNELAERTRADLDEGTIAVWHDESHLNWYASTHPTTVLGSEYCYAPGFPNLTDISPRIIAVDKADDRTR